MEVNQMRLLDSDVCWHRWQDSQAHCHMVWRCPTIKELWDNVTLSLGIFLHHTVTWDPFVCLLNLSDQDFWPSHHKRFLTLGCMTAKRLIALHWKCVHLVDADQSFPNMLAKEKSTSNLVDLYSEEPEWSKVDEPNETIPLFRRLNPN